MLVRKMPLILFCEGRSSLGRPRSASYGVVLLKLISKGKGWKGSVRISGGLLCTWK